MEFQSSSTQAIIHLDHLRHNARALMDLLPGDQKFVAVIKANGYGHGIKQVAQTLSGIGVQKFGVAGIEEAAYLREQGIKGEIYTFNGLTGQPSQYDEHQTYPVLSNLTDLKAYADYAKKQNKQLFACLKFDTGMGRLGFLPSQINQVAEIFESHSLLTIQGVLSHFACADIQGHELTDRQSVLFKKIIKMLGDRGLTDFESCICNSAALIEQKIDDTNWVKPGIALYGCYPSEHQQSKIDLKPVLTLKSKIISLKTLSKGSTIGYGATFTTERDSVIATIGTGYADGYPRLASNRGHVLINGQKAAIVGRVSMRLINVDVTDIEGVKLHDSATLIGKDGEQTIAAEQVAEWAETISYEILCGISDEVQRIYEGL